MFAASKTDSVSGETPDPQFNYVTMLLHGDGTNGAQNNTFLDSSTNNFTITRNGNTTQGSFSPYGSNWSNYFTSSSGVGAYLRAPSSSAMQLGSGNFTIECWVFLDKVAENAFIGRSPFDNTNNEWVFQSGPSNNIRFAYSTNGSDSQTVLESTTNIPISTWTHVAVVRNSSTLTFYINGTSVGSSSISATIYSGNTTTTIGSYAQSAYPNGYAVPNGYLSNIRLVKGTAVYTSNFTPSTTPLTAISGTSMLTCQSNRFLDNSSNNFTFTTVNGAPSVQRFSPFGTTTAYSTSVIGGSAYFDGTGDYLSVANDTALQFGTGDFTVEGWFYMTGGNFSNNALFSIGSYNGGILLRYKAAGSDNFYFNNTGYDWNPSTNFRLNQWNHVAVVRSGTTVSVYVNGTSVFSVTNSSSLAQSTATSIGTATHDVSNESCLGYISNFRMVKGTAVYTANFTPPTAQVTAITNTSLLTNFTNGAIFDNAMINNLETAGNAQISTSVKKYGTGSLYFDGSADWLSILNTSTSTISGNGSWTIEGWIYPTTVDTAFRTIYITGYPLQIFVRNNTVVAYFSENTTGGPYFINGLLGPASSVSTNVWTHFAVVNNATTYTVYINGVGGTSATNSTSIVFPTNANATIGDAPAFGSFPFIGYMDDIRITKGYARYTANFTPPTAAFFNKGPY
jgi:hypothetical protein